MSYWSLSVEKVPPYIVAHRVAWVWQSQRYRLVRIPLTNSGVVRFKLFRENTYEGDLYVYDGSVWVEDCDGNESNIAFASVRKVREALREIA